jgi:hypothetical protein
LKRVKREARQRERERRERKRKAIKHPGENMAALPQLPSQRRNSGAVVRCGFSLLLVAIALLLVLSAVAVKAELVYDDSKAAAGVADKTPAIESLSLADIHDQLQVREMFEMWFFFFCLVSRRNRGERPDF